MESFLNGNIQLHHGECLQLMNDLPSESIDLILCDLPYGTTGNKWDSIIPLDLLWAQYKRIIRKDSMIVLFGSQPFTSTLVSSNPRAFKYEWIWNKKLAGNGILAKKQPLKIHESVLIFCYGKAKYFPIKTKGKGRYKLGVKDKFGTFGGASTERVWNDEYYPLSIIEYSVAGNRTKTIHPTQKPVALLEYLIRTYTQENETILDNTFGSCSTGIAALNTNRKFIGIELDENFYSIGKNRIINHLQTLQQIPLLSPS